jgi:hypothetical protein
MVLLMLAIPSCFAVSAAVAVCCIGPALGIHVVASMHLSAATNGILTVLSHNT